MRRPMMLIGGWWLRAWWTRCRRRCRISLLSICMRRRLATCLGSGLVGLGGSLGALGEGLRVWMRVWVLWVGSVMRVRLWMGWTVSSTHG